MKNAKLPPHAKELEENIIGAIIFSIDDYLQVADILRPEMFYYDKNQIIFSIVQQISVEGGVVSILTVHQKLIEAGKLNQAGGLDYLIEVNSKVVSTSNLEYEARIVSQMYTKRELILASNETVNNCYDPTKDVFEVLDAYEAKRDGLMNFVITKKEILNEVASNEWIQELEKKSKLSDQDVTGVETGFYKLNKLTAGWQSSDLIILAARPAMGKTALMLKFALNAAKNNQPVLIFSLEMAKEKLIDRCISILSEVELFKIIKPSTLNPEDWQAVKHAHLEFKRLPIIWDDSANLSFIELVSKAKRARRKHGVKMVFIDYLQLIASPNPKEVRERQIAAISRGLKILAKELKIPVMALSQLSRQCEQRSGLLKRPQMSDLRESGAIEQDADLVSFLFRPEYYGITEDEVNESMIGKAEYIIGKNRNGETDILVMDFIGKNTNFKDLETDFPPFPTNLNDYANHNFGKDDMPDDNPF